MPRVFVNFVLELNWECLNPNTSADLPTSITNKLDAVIHLLEKLTPTPTELLTDEDMAALRRLLNQLLDVCQNTKVADPDVADTVVDTIAALSKKSYDILVRILEMKLINDFDPIAIKAIADNKRI